MSPSEKLVQRLSRFVRRQDPRPSAAAGSVPTTLFTQTVTPSTPASESLASATASITQTSAPLPSTTSISPTLTSTIQSTPQPSQPPAATNGSQKYVIAHHMVGNTFPYTLQNWKQDIALAHAAGIDGFALNVGSDSWEPARVADA